MIQRVTGTQDHLDLNLYTSLLDALRNHMSLHNFSQIETPILEKTELFAHNLGEESDVVTKEMYTLTTQSGDQLCLRPEATASSVRAFLENKVDAQPWRVFSVGPMFRHERPQKGRWRQFTQFNMEVINTSQLAHDALFIKMLDYFFDEILGIDDYVLKTNFLGTREDRAAHREALVRFLELHTQTICKTCNVRCEKNPLRVFDCKNETCKKLYREAPVLTDFLSDESEKEWLELNTQLDMLSVSRVHDPALVRGLDYYGKTVFEFSSPHLGAQDAFCGGGRYSLGAGMGAKQDVECIGAALGMGRLQMLVEMMGDKFAVTQRPRLHMILPLGPQHVNLALMLNHELAQKGLCADVVLPAGNPGKMMKKANKAGAAFALLLGDQEMTDGTVTVKNMMSGEQEVVKQADIAAWLKR